MTYGNGEEKKRNYILNKQSSQKGEYSDVAKNIKDASNDASLVARKKVRVKVKRTTQGVEKKNVEMSSQMEESKGRVTVSSHKKVTSPPNEEKANSKVTPSIIKESESKEEKIDVAKEENLANSSKLLSPKETKNNEKKNRVIFLF